MKAILLAGAAVALAGPARAFAALNFDATTVTPDAGFEPLPVGWYNATIDESEMKPTQDGTGAYLKLRFSVVDGQYAGRKIFTQLNLKNSNPQTVEIAQKQLSAICHAVKVLKPQQSEELHGKPLKIKLKYVASVGNYSEKNEITSYKPIDADVDTAGGDAGAAAFGAGAPQAPAGFGAGAPAAAEGAPAQPWAQPPAAGLAGPPSGAAPAQPWSQPPASPEAAPAPAPAPAAPPAPPAAPPAAPQPPHDPMAAAKGDGWTAHPSAPGYHYKGQEVKLDADVAALYPAPAVPAAPPSPPAAPAAPPAAPAATAPAPAPASGASPSDGGTAPPPWAQAKA